MRSAISFAVLLLAAGSASAQAERYELGQRLKAFEQQWDKTKDEKLKLKAAEGLPKLTGMFFTGQFGEAGRTLDEARWILEGKKPTDDEKWAASLYFVPESRYTLTPGNQFSVTVNAFYPVKSAKPKELKLEIEIPSLTPASTLTIDSLPAKVDLTFTHQSPKMRAGGDHPLRVTVRLGDVPVVRREVGVSFEPIEKGYSADLAKTLASAEARLKPNSLELASALHHIDLLRSLNKGTVSETDIPAWSLHQRVGEFAYLQQEKKDFFTPDRPGQFWLSIPTGKSSTPARLYVPPHRGLILKGEEDAKNMTLVVALHGAGGSENMFFEGYGDGQILKLCQKRGWMLLCPRSELSLVGGAPPVGELVDELAKRYPIDPKKIFIVGHSMGAMQAIDAVQKYPGKFAGLAAFGGDGRIRKPELFAELPTFLAVGDKDFTLNQVRKLKKTLEDAKAKAVTYREYPGLEHLLIVREALPDAFALFDTIGKK